MFRGLLRACLKVVAGAEEKLLPIPDTACNAAVHTFSSRIGEGEGEGKKQTPTYEAAEEIQHDKARQAEPD